MPPLHHPYRHAAYFAPAPDSLAWSLGSQWLGRCARSGLPLPQPVPTGIDAPTLARLTQAPRRYGWHATLKAPFSLDASARPAQLHTAFTQLAAAVANSFTLEVEVAQVGDFLALVPLRRSDALHALADACVRELQPFAAPLPDTELARRRQGGLSPRQERMLLQWGYPFVMQDFQFHLTLSGSLAGVSDAHRSALAAHARQWFAPVLARGVLIDAVSWFVEDTPGADFRWQERFAFAPWAPAV